MTDMMLECRKQITQCDRKLGLKFSSAGAMVYRRANERGLSRIPPTERLSQELYSMLRKPPRARIIGVGV
jgi:hypothetical protein